MKKYINLSFIYAIAGMLAGLFYRLFTKSTGFTGSSLLSTLHTHLFTLGMMMFMIVALFVKITEIEKVKNFRRFLILYNIGLPFMILSMFIRGITQVMDISLGSGLNGAISAMAGISHILLTTAIALLLLSMKKISQES